MRRYHLLLSITLLLALCLLPACSQGQKGGPPAAGEPEVTVVTMTPKTITLTTELPGRTSAHLVSEVRPQVGGIIQKRLFKEGGEVKAGEVLYQIDPSTYQAAYENAKAGLARAEANALPAKLKGERFSSLAQVRAVSQQDNDDAQAARKQAEAEVVAARATLETTRINLSYTRVIAPISGRIGKSSVTPGALVTASQGTPLATIQQIDPIYVDVTQSSMEVMRLKRDLQSGRLRKSVDGGAQANLILEDGTPYPLEGTLQFADITVDQSTGAVTLRAVFPNPDRYLLPGLYVRAVLSGGVNEDALLVPQPAVSRDSKGNALVMVVKPDGVVESRPIEIAQASGSAWLVSSGLAAGERVIVDGLQKVRPGVKVKAVEAAPVVQEGGAQSNATQPSATQPSATQPSGTQPSGTQPSGTQPSGTQPSATQPSGTQPSGAAPAPEAQAVPKVAAKAEKKTAPSAEARDKKRSRKSDGLPRPKKGEGRVYSPSKDGPPQDSQAGQ